MPGTLALRHSLPAPVSAAVSALLLAALLLTGCAKPAPVADATPPASTAQTQPAPGSVQDAEAAKMRETASKPHSPTTPPLSDDAACDPLTGVLQGQCVSMNQEKVRGQCYSLRPGATTTKRDKKGKTVKVAGRCQPQSLIYARCRTGIDTCRLGDTSPVQWFTCAQRNGATTRTPTPGSVMVLDANKGRGMPTGHPVYVEETCPNKDGTWTLRITHTNYDRQCHLDQDAKVRFNPKTMQATFLTGPWGCWAKDLKAMGFILR
ncbi:CHAP domain-containing protein [Nitratidesulfovibrio sp. HK-II]|uniref:hypothetical protein n=1 Tax=Nitratidesulfovibrio sp. HK-II TaxID=2009266 RepID=UPI000E2F369A|nr:hypothetical protein [Nitratidesulfovibrio sp. HK-II]GBO97062.1 hypothetical protein RVX_2101 [Nitratidesulfovibrio sp. HK-II]